MIMNEKRNNVIKTYLTDKEYNLFTTLVMQSGLNNQSEFIRRNVLKNNNEKIIPGQFFLDRLIQIRNEILKKFYVIENLAAAILVELTKKERNNVKELVAKFIIQLEEEAENFYKGGN